ncbi:hypothetical protein [Undibacter mobilis]|uniref:Uncharacterized protein n=1 Tax=Undibacter mobilis TaxID=2292256 RepID=A0A371BDE2_9BRAD|nr:hypothetical protein [Undibacter mobilis]RDV05568.1 hypothetical protein DXH78_13880 [Undibacter mobilis]
MFKVTRSFNAAYAVITAALIAGIFTAATAPGSRLAMAPGTEAVQTAAKSCAGEPWPYLNCTGGQTGEQTVRVIRIN